MWRLLVVLVVMMAAAIALADRPPVNPQQQCAALGLCGNISSSITSIPAQPVTSTIPEVQGACTFPATFPCTMN